MHNQLMLEKVTALAAIKRTRERWGRSLYDATALIADFERRGPPKPPRTRDVVALI